MCDDTSEKYKKKSLNKHRIKNCVTTRIEMLNVTLTVSSAQKLKVLKNEKFYYANGGEWLAYSSCFRGSFGDNGDNGISEVFIEFFDI